MTGQRRGRHRRTRHDASASHTPTTARPRYAAIDLGTNNCRLLVAERTPDGFRVVDAFSRIVRLGEGLARDGTLSEPAMRRAIGALKVCADKLGRHRIVHQRAVATEACRRAANADAFRRRVQAETGIALQVIPQAEEARLALTGCAPLLDPAVPNALVFDIGGGSTEVIWLRGNDGARAAAGSDTAADRPGHSHGIAAWYSMPVGVVSLAERHGATPPDTAAYDTMVGEVAQILQELAARHAIVDVFASGGMQMIGTSGTVTTLTGVYQDLARYDRRRVDGCFLGFETVRTVSRRIAAMTADERRAHPCIGHNRADFVVPGCAILEAICRTWPVGRLRVADRGLREGMLLQMMGHVDTDALAAPPASVTAAAPCGGA